MARRKRARLISDQSRSAPAHAAKHSPPIVPVTVIRTPAAAAAATPSLPRMSTDAAAPTLGPTGSWSERRHGDQHGDRVEERASTPTACNSSQLRKICANTATSTKPITRLPWPSLRSTARPLHSSRLLPCGELPQAGAEPPRPPRGI